MKALVKFAEGPGFVDVRDVGTPEPEALQVRVEVSGAGVCGTDLHIIDGEFPSVPGVVMGHEVAGTVTAVGDGVDPSWLGARVVTETYFSTCRSCTPCRTGRPNLCSDRRSIGSRVNGGFAPDLVVPATNLHRIPDWLDGHAAALAEPLACVANCLLDPPLISTGDSVLVVGPGPIGLLAAQVARLLGGEVTVVGLPTDEVRLAAAGALGFVTTDSGVPPASHDVVLECSGAAAGAAAALYAARPRGRFVQIGVFGRDVSVPLDLVLLKELVVTSGFASTPRSWQLAMDLIDRKEVELSPLVSRVAALAEWRDVFEELRCGRGLKTIFDPRL